jgi:hypothetical protein
MIPIDRSKIGSFFYAQMDATLEKSKLDMIEMPGVEWR